MAFRYLLIVWVILAASGFSAQADELVLDKLRLDRNISLGDSACDELMYIDKDKDVYNMRGFPCFERTGKYTLTLDASPGTLVTLYGESEFGKNNGFLILKKIDDQPLWILDLENVSAGSWTHKAKTRDSGAYEAFYRPAPLFKENIASIQWGKWWTDGIPKPTIR